MQMRKLASKFSPVSQFKFYMDLQERMAYAHNDRLKKLEPLYRISQDMTLGKIVARVGAGKQNVIYCSSRRKVVDYAKQYAKTLAPSTNPKLKKLATDIRNDVHKECYLADLLEKGIAYHVGYLPANIRLRIETSFAEGDIRTIFCTSTLVEGVNLPADNLFITSYRNGQTNMDEVEFRNLVGRVGRIKYNLYGNVFLIRMDKRDKEEKYMELLTNEVPEQKLSIDLDVNQKGIPALVEDLVSGNVEMSLTHGSVKEKDFDTLRKYGLILIHDYAIGDDSPLAEIFKDYVTEEQKKQIKANFPLMKTNDDITLSYDQATSLRQLIEKGAKYPELKGENDDVDFEELFKFLCELSRVFKWAEYEHETIGRSYNVLRWYAVILLQWIRGNGLSTIIESAIRYKENHPDTGVWVGNNKLADRYDKNSRDHKNYIIAETLGVIENVLLFSISNYFRKFSLEFKAYHNVDSFENDWYEYVEYGTTNTTTIFLQRVGFTRDSAQYLEKPVNYKKYITKIGDEIKVRKSAGECGNESVEMDIREIQFNMPELFVD